LVDQELKDASEGRVECGAAQSPASRHHNSAHQWGDSAQDDTEWPEEQRGPNGCHGDSDGHCSADARQCPWSGVGFKADLGARCVSDAPL